MKNVVPVIENDNQLNRIKTLDLKAITKNARIQNCKKKLVIHKKFITKACNPAVDGSEVEE